MPSLFSSFHLSIVGTLVLYTSCSTTFVFFYVENVNLRGYKWNETVSNRICNVSNEIRNNVIIGTFLGSGNLTRYHVNESTRCQLAYSIASYTKEWN
jgi:hypothetical protein